MRLIIDLPAAIFEPPGPFAVNGKACLVVAGKDIGAAFRSDRVDKKGFLLAGPVIAVNEKSLLHGGRTFSRFPKHLYRINKTKASQPRPVFGGYSRDLFDLRRTIFAQRLDIDSGAENRFEYLPDPRRKGRGADIGHEIPHRRFKYSPGGKRGSGHQAAGSHNRPGQIFQRPLFDIQCPGGGRVRRDYYTAIRDGCGNIGEWSNL